MDQGITVHAAVLPSPAAACHFLTRTLAMIFPPFRCSRHLGSLKPNSRAFPWYLGFHTGSTTRGRSFAMTGSLAGSRINREGGAVSTASSGSGRR
jgi:hypothetical protein